MISPASVLFLAASLLLAAPRARAADLPVQFRGRVTDAATREPLPAAIVRILGTARGTIANAEGEFALSVEPGSYRIGISSVGYSPDTLVVDLQSSARQDVALVSSPVVLPEVVVTSEDPAVEIVRRAIERKKRWFQRLQTYELDAFTRQTVRRDTGIAAIAESFTRGYWQRGDTLREVVQQKRQTANMKAADNFASVGRILNFSEDRVRFIGYSFVGPIADDALDYYDVRLKGTHRDGATEVFEILLVPRTRTTPLFRGTISIAGDSYALVGVIVEPNEAFILPFVKDRSLVYRQQFALYDGEFWLPADIRVEASFTVGLVGLTLPRIGLEQTSVMSDYRVNIPLPDTIFRKPRLTIDSSAVRYDSTQWASTRILPLDAEESRAYASLDSTQKLDVQFRPTGITATLGGEMGTAGLLIDLLDVAYNRVEGFHLGVQYSPLHLAPWLTGSFRWGYGVSSRMSTYLLGTGISPFKGSSLLLGGEAYRRMDHRPDAGYYGTFLTSLGALLSKEDYRDYYRAEGWDAFLELPLTRNSLTRVTFVAERQRSVAQQTEYSLFFRSRAFRQNPPVREGNLRAIQADVRIGKAPAPLDLVATDALDFSVEYSDPRFASSDFLYTRYAVTGTLSIPTFGEAFFLRPRLNVRVFAGGSSGMLPPQRWFDTESRLSIYGPFGVLRSAGVKEFSGTSAMSLVAEHNFRSIPFLLLGIPFLYENGIEFLLHGGAARTWTRDPEIVNTTPAWHLEAGFGISRVLGLLRVDGTWRLTGSRGFFFTVGIAPLL
jgi:hypothetical protein